MYSIEGYKGIKLLSEHHAIKVFLAFTVDTNTGVIIKILSKEQMTAASKRSFFFEYELASQYKFEHGMEVRKFEELDDYFLMELNLIGGTSLKETIIINKLEATQIVKIALLMCDAVFDLHHENIIHKDLNPSNFIISSTLDKVYVVDYGLCEYYHDRDEAVDLTSLSHGNAHYMSPEQTGRINKKIDFRSDLYTLGVCFYEFFTGVLPFEGKDIQEILYAQVAKLPPEPKSLNSSLDSKINDLIVKLLKKEPKDRYQSIYGLKQDLLKILDNLSHPLSTKDFLLGQEDMPMLFSLSSAIVGRQHELLQIEKSCIDACENRKSLLVVKGSSGIGKSALVESKTESFYINKSLYLRSKSEQYKEPLPLNAWSDILKLIIVQIEQTPKDRQKKIVEALKNGLNVQLDILVQFVPKMAALFDSYAYVKIEKNYTHNPLYAVVTKFLMIIADHWNSLVLFFDDIQWIDQASIDLIAYVLNDTELKKILIIGAYRPEDIGKNHPVKRLEKNFSSLLTTITLEALKTEDIKYLLEESLVHRYEDLTLLSELIFKKCHGNPFYFKALMEKIYALKYLYFNPKSELWEYKADDIAAMSVTENVISLLTEKVDGLSPLTKNFLCDASILSSEIELFLLSHVFHDKYDEAALDHALKDALAQQMIFRQQGRYFFVQDKVQELFYQLVSKSHIKEIKEKIAYFLIENHWVDNEKYLFMAYNFLRNKKITKSKKFLYQLMEVTLECVLLLKNKIAYDEAKRYLEELDLNSFSLDWNNKNDFSHLFTYYFEYASLLYINAEHEESQRIIEELLKHAKGIKEIVKIFGLQKMMLATNVKDIKKIKELGVCIADQLKLEFATALKDQERSIKLLENKIGTMLKHLPSFDDLPAMKSDEKQYAMRFLMDFWEVAYYDQNENYMALCELNMVYLTLKYGITKESAFGYVVHGARLASQQNYKEAFTIGYAGINLNHKLHDLEQLPKVHNLFANYINPYVRSWKSSTNLYDESIVQSQKNGDIVFGIWAVNFQKWTHLFWDTPLSMLYENYKRDERFLVSSGDEKMIKAYRDLGSFLEGLHCQEGSGHDITKNLAYYKQQAFAPAFTWNLLLQALRAIIDLDDEKAYLLLTHKDIELRESISMFPTVHFHFLFAFALVAKIKKAPNKITKNSMRAKLDTELSFLSNLAKSAPENFLVSYLLIRAEVSTLEGDYWESVALFQLAIDESRRHKGQLLRALSCERFSVFLEKHDIERSRKMLSAAYNEYESWGAFNKTAAIINEHGVWLQANNSMHVSNEVFSRTSSYSNDALNINAIFNATQLIASELDSTKLLDKLGDIMLSQSNAQELLIVKPVQKKWECILRTPPVEDNTKLILPIEVFKDVARHKSMIFVDDFDQSQRFTGSAFFKERKPKSFLAMPLLDENDNIEMILYAQNNILSGAFSLVHQKVLLYLMRQASIALINANLVASLKEEVEANVRANKQVSLLTQVVEQSPLMIMITLSNGKIIYINDAFTKTTGFSQKEALGSTPNLLKSDIQHPYFYKELWQTLQEKKVWRGELINRKKDKSHYYEYQTVAPIVDDDGKVTHYIAFKEDITLTKEREKLFFMQARQAQMGEMLSMIAHQWRQPLSAISGIALNNKLLIELERIDTNKMLEGFEKIEDLVVFLSSTINDFRNFFKPDKEVSTVELKLLLERSLALLEGVIRGHSITINLHMDENPTIKSYDNELVQVIMNILKNAIDIIIEKSMLDGRIDITYQRLGNFHRLEIADNAGGIPVEYLNEVFMPYFSTKKEKQGTGLGLYMSKTIIEDHCKGSLTVKNIKGGANFIIELPVEGIKEIKKSK